MKAFTTLTTIWYAHLNRPGSSEPMCQLGNKDEQIEQFGFASVMSYSMWLRSLVYCKRLQTDKMPQNLLDVCVKEKIRCNLYRLEGFHANTQRVGKGKVRKKLLYWKTLIAFHQEDGMRIWEFHSLYLSPAIHLNLYRFKTKSPNTNTKKKKICH